MSSLNPSWTLYRETLCEHGRQEVHDIDCLGGTRKKVTINYEAAALSLNRILVSEGLAVRFDGGDMEDVVNSALGE